MTSRLQRRVERARRGAVDPPCPVGHDPELWARAVAEVEAALRGNV